MLTLLCILGLDTDTLGIEDPTGEVIGRIGHNAGVSRLPVYSTQKQDTILWFYSSERNFDATHAPRFCRGHDDLSQIANSREVGLLRCRARRS